MGRGHLIHTLFGAPRALIGMLHVGPLAGSPLHRQTAKGRVEAAAGVAKDHER
jgi:predicted TIM-barrel enzyme